MRIAVQNPTFIFEDPSNLAAGYAWQFIKHYRPAIYLTEWAQVWAYCKRLKSLGLNPFSFKFLLSEKALNRHAQVLVCFNGQVYDERNCPAKSFTGLKVAHVGQFYKNPKQANERMLSHGVDFVLGHGDHASHSVLFQEHYSSFCDCLLPVPIGFAPQFNKRRAFDSRQPLCLISTQMPGYICDPNDREGCQIYYEYYSQNDVGFPWLQELRKRCLELAHLLQPLEQEDLMSSQVSFKVAKNLNESMLFAVDYNLLGYPSARVFEGLAAGAVLVAPQHAGFKELGFEHGKNCLLHKPGDIIDFERCIQDALSDIPHLAKIANEATHWVHNSFSHEAIARWLVDSLEEMANSSQVYLSV